MRLCQFFVQDFIFCHQHSYCSFNSLVHETSVHFFRLLWGLKIWNSPKLLNGLIFFFCLTDPREVFQFRTVLQLRTICSVYYDCYQAFSYSLSERLWCEYWSFLVYLEVALITDTRQYFFCSLTTSAFAFSTFDTAAYVTYV